MTRPTVVVCTRDRPDSCQAAVASVLEARTEHCQIIVVDQSRDERTRVALEALTSDAAVLVYVKSVRRGLSAARNEAARAAMGDLLLFTDDDCLVDPDWVRAWCRALQDPAIGIGFGAVSSPPCDMTTGYIADFHLCDGTYGRELFLRGAGQVAMGANMALRRELWERVGGFDEGLGAGTRFPSAEDLDMAYRVVRAGFLIRHTVEARVRHLGYRSGAGASTLVRGYVTGIAAAYAKHVRCGDRFAARLLALETGRHFLGVLRRAVERTRPLGVRSLLAYLVGAGSSWTHSLDVERRLYRPEDHSHAA